jgi:arabinose-5-phosphate isomerase
MDPDPDQLLIDSAKRTIGLEGNAVLALRDVIGPAFAAACQLLVNTTGRVVVTGMGKSGHVAGKIAATLASTGTPAFFVHPGEASHGDMGMITRNDCVLALSNSGNTGEIITLLPLIKRLNIPLISITGNAESELALASRVHLLAAVESEACPLN